MGIAGLILLSPLGLILPEHFKAGPAWGEWGVDAMRKLAGYMPKGLARLSSLWGAPLPDYAFKGGQVKGLARLSIAYIISGLTGIALIIVVVLFIGKILTKKDS